GGPYLYARVAFGRLMGIEMGWMLWLSQLSAPAANANLFVIYLAEFWPRANDPVPRFLILTLLVGILAVINYRGVRSGTQVSNFFTIAKLLPRGLVIIMGAACMFTMRAAATAAMPTAGLGEWLKTILLLVFAYGGFESALKTAIGKDQQQDCFQPFP